MKKTKKYSQLNLKKYLNKLKKETGRFNLSLRYYRDTNNVKEHNQILKVFKQFRNMNVLDVGCHIGYYATLISSFANKVVGIDIDKEVIKKAHKFKNITGATNAEFNVMSAFEVDIDFMKKNDLNAVFIHKTVGDSESNLHWPTEDFHNVFSLFEKHCDIIICNNIIRVKEFFKDKPFSIKESRSFRKNYLYTIKRNNSI